MTEDSGALDAAAAPAAPPAPPAPAATAGGLLREAREAAGLHIAALAVSMKVPVAKLEALEADRFDLLPDAVFARALAAGVCRTLKMDPRPVLDKLPQSAKPTLKDNERGIDAPFRSPSDGPGPGLLDQLSWPVVAVGALVLGMVGIYLYPHARTDSATSAGVPEPVLMDKPNQILVVQSPDAPPPGSVVETPTQQLQAAGPAAGNVPPMAPSVMAPVQTPAPLNSPVQAPSQTPVQAAPFHPSPTVAAPPQTAAQVPASAAQARTPQVQPAAKPASATPALAKSASAPSTQAKTALAPVALAKAASNPVAPVKPASAPLQAAASTASQPVAFAASSGTLVLKAKAASWVSVIDARGTSVLNKVLSAGEVAAVSGATPLKVTVGKADGTEVLVRGKAFDLAPVARENVARFEVK